MKQIYNHIMAARAAGNKMIALLIDPDKCKDEKISLFARLAKECSPDFIFIGGSLTTESTEKAIENLKKETDTPIILFPGNAMQFSEKADALLFLSLISGRNADFLIGQHVVSAPFIRKSKIEVISTGYMLIESGTSTSVEYMSNTKAIPREKTDIAVATAIAGEMLGTKMIYLEAGSGAKLPVPQNVITAVKNNIHIPLIVGGGLRDIESINKALDAGADLVVVGNALEKEPSLMKILCETTRNHKKK